MSALNLLVAVTLFAGIRSQAPMDPGRYADVNGLKMYYEVHGMGRPLVLIHGSFGTAVGWGKLLFELSKSRQVIVVELQGHGHTADRDTPLSFDQMADDVAALLKSINVKEADVFGYSMGGTVAFGLAIRHPQIVGKLATLGSVTGSTKETYEPVAYNQIQSLPANFAPPVLKDPYDKVAPDPKRWPALVQKIKNLSRDFKGFSPEQVKSIKAETLIMLGDREGIRPEHGVEMYRAIQHSRLCVFPGGDHFLLFIGTDKVLATLTAFLDSPPR